jgi:hypothetical protein
VPVFAGRRNDEHTAAHRLPQLEHDAHHVGLELSRAGAHHQRVIGRDPGCELVERTTGDVAGEVDD